MTSLPSQVRAVQNPPVNGAVDSITPPLDRVLAEKPVELPTRMFPSREQDLQRLLTQTLSTLLSELEQVLDATSPRHSDLILELIESATAPSDSVGIDKFPRGDRRLANIPMGKGHQHETTSLHRPDIVTQQEPSIESPGQRITKKGADTIYYANDQKVANVPAQKESRSLFQSSLRGSEESKYPFAHPDGLTDEVPVSRAPFQVDRNRSAQSSYQPNRISEQNQLLRGHLPSPPVQHQQSPHESSSADASTGISTASNPQMVPPQGSTGKEPVSSLTRLSELRELLISILREPGALRNELEPTIFKSILRALPSLELPHYMQLTIEEETYEATPDTRNTSTAGENSERANTQVKDSTRSPAQQFTPRGMREIHGRNEVESPFATPTSSGLRSERSLPIQLITSPELTLKGLTSDFPPRQLVGVLSDSALLSALQGASLKRSYSTFSGKRAPKKRHTTTAAPSNEETLNDTNKESTGLFWLRALLERRRPDQ